MKKVHDSIRSGFEPEHDSRTLLGAAGRINLGKEITDYTITKPASTSHSPTISTGTSRTEVLMSLTLDISS